MKTDNNFDLIRLVAALQVALTHILYHMEYGENLIPVLRVMPGVPIFFFVSGYLIYQSWEKVKMARPAAFFVNRFLRIFPALVFCVLLALASVYISGYMKGIDVPIWSVAAWTAGQVTIFQFYNPSFMREYGTGVLNGSLWTIAVEIQFYFLTPLLSSAFARGKGLIACLFAVLFVLNIVNNVFRDDEVLAWKIYGVTFVPWLYMFMVGACLAANPDWVNWIQARNPAGLMALYLISHAGSEYLGAGSGNAINAVSYVLLCALVINLAYKRPLLSRRLLGGTDISYGIYIFHMPVVNYLLYINTDKSLSSVLTALAATIGFATICWFLIERPALRLKPSALVRR